MECASHHGHQAVTGKRRGRCTVPTLRRGSSKGAFNNARLRPRLRGTAFTISARLLCGCVGWPSRSNHRGGRSKAIPTTARISRAGWLELLRLAGFGIWLARCADAVRSRPTVPRPQPRHPRRLAQARQPHPQRGAALAPRGCDRAWSGNTDRIKPTSLATRIAGGVVRSSR